MASVSQQLSAQASWVHWTLLYDDRLTSACLREKGLDSPQRKASLEALSGRSHDYHPEPTRKRVVRPGVTAAPLEIDDQTGFVPIAPVDYRPAPPRLNKPRLKDVTVAVADCIRPDLAARALQICLDKCEFADAVLFSNTAVAGPFRSEPIPPLRSLNDYTRFCLREMPARIATRFVLVVQWDGYVVDSSAWSSDFTRYDFIGARAPYVTPGGERRWFVGNGGFSLRSRRLLAALGSLPIVDGMNEDQIICQAFRTNLERDYGIRFAPEKVADRFSFEQARARTATFGFHGLENLHRVESDAEVLRMVDRLTPAEWRDGRIFTLINEALRDGRVALARRLFDRVRVGNTSATLRAIVSRVYGSDAFARGLVDRLEALVREPEN